MQLTTREQTELAECEAVIERTRGAVYEAGQALRKIRDNRLYRGTHDTFEEYCRDKYDYSRFYAHRLIEAAKVAENLLPMGNIPSSERQARELASLEPEQQREVWQEAVKTAPNGHVTAAHIRETRQAYTTPAIIENRIPANGWWTAQDLRDHREQQAGITAVCPHVAHNSGNNEWYTPAPYVDAAFNVMGGIDLDPASSAVANEIIEASTYYTAEDDGLSKEWRGRVWMNPPYAGELIGKFTSKLCQHFNAGEITEAIVLVNNATETQWFQEMAEIASAICFPKGRVKFWHPERESAPLQGQAVLYLGKKPEKFRAAFTAFGFVGEL